MAPMSREGSDAAAVALAVCVAVGGASICSSRNLIEQFNWAPPTFVRRYVRVRERIGRRSTGRRGREKKTGRGEERSEVERRGERREAGGKRREETRTGRTAKAAKRR
jgi:hypothetical protein